jgi:capsule polysaccharide export protein KpsE/RkpR
MVAAMILVSEVVLAAVVFLSGAVTPGKAADVVKVLQGSLASPPEAALPEVKPKEAPKSESQDELQAAVAEWEKTRKAQEDDLLAQKQAVESMSRELENVRAELDAREKSLRDRTGAFDAARAAEEAAARDQGFLDAVAGYNAMESKDVAGLLFGLDDPTVVRYLKAFKPAFRAEMLTEIKKIDDKSQPPSVVNRAARLQELISGDSVAATAEAAVAPQP